MTTQTRLFGVAHCASCGAELPGPAPTGRPRQWCSDACRKRATRTRPETLSALAVHSDPSDAAPATGSPRARSLAEVAAGIPTPVDAHLGPCRAYLTLADNGVRPWPEPSGKGTWRVAFALDGGHVMQPVGPAMDRRHAARLADLLNARLA